MPVYLKCQVCGVEFGVPPVRANTAKTCSNECARTVRAKSIERKVTLTCPECQKPFDVPRSHEGRRTYCSHKCREASEAYQHAKGARLSGAANPSWKGGVVEKSDGYIYRLVGREHPFSTEAGYLLEHRAVMEKHLRDTDPESPFLITLGLRRYLSPDIEVHHDDENRSNNHISNLECMTPGDHARLHNARRRA
jgi:hypothetical protein